MNRAITLSPKKRFEIFLYTIIQFAGLYRFAPSNFRNRVFPLFPMILLYGCAPFVIGSLYGLIPALLLAVAFVFRTYFEDRMLYKELPGYREYTKKVRYRLVPFIW